MRWEKILMKMKVVVKMILQNIYITNEEDLHKWKQNNKKMMKKRQKSYTLKNLKMKISFDQKMMIAMKNFSKKNKLYKNKKNQKRNKD